MNPRPLQGLQQAHAQQQRRHFLAAGVVRLQQLQGCLGFAVLLQQQGFAEQQLAVFRVFQQQTIKAVQ